jgi:hypothetical protein
MDNARGAGLEATLGVAGVWTALVDRDEGWEELLRGGILKGRPRGRLGLDGERVDFAILELALTLSPETRPAGRTRYFFSRVMGALLPLRGAMAYHGNSHGHVCFSPPSQVFLL